MYSAKILSIPAKSHQLALQPCQYFVQECQCAVQRFQRFVQTRQCAVQWCQYFVQALQWFLQWCQCFVQARNGSCRGRRGCCKGLDPTGF